MTFAIVDSTLPDKERAESDLSYFARKILGYDYWKIGGQLVRNGTEWRGEWHDTCGLVDWGPHGEMIDFVRQPSPTGRTQVLLLMTSRGSLKTSLVMADIMQNIVVRPDERALVHMETYAKACETVDTIKRELQDNEKIRKLWGELKTKAWSQERIIVKRTMNRRDATLFASGTDKVVTGNHVDRAYVDDPVSWQQALSPDQMKKAKKAFSMLIPIVDPGGKIIVTMTPYSAEDLGAALRAGADELGEELELATLEKPCGMHMEYAEDGSLTLVGEPVFPHLPEQELLARLKLMEVLNEAGDFNSQYALLLNNPEDQLFFRKDFREHGWVGWMSSSNAYVLTDTAVSDKDAACFSVIALVIVDWEDNAYLCDLRVGRWKPPEFVDEFFDVHQQWQGRTRIVGTTMEDIALNKVYASNIDERAKNSGVRINWIRIPRGGGDAAKRMRIRGLANRFRAGKFHVVTDTMPRHYVDRGKTRILWDPQRAYGQHGKREPGGTLVDQFIYFRMQGGGTEVDIPDCLADIDQVSTRGTRYCYPTPRPQWADEIPRARWGGHRPWLERQPRVQRTPGSTVEMPWQADHLRRNA